MFGYIKKDELLKTLKQEMELQQSLNTTYNQLALSFIEQSRSAKTEDDRKVCNSEYHKHIRWAMETNIKWCEAVTIYNMVKQM